MDLACRLVGQVVAGPLFTILFIFTHRFYITIPSTLPFLQVFLSPQRAVLDAFYEILLSEWFLITYPNIYVLFTFAC